MTEVYADLLHRGDNLGMNTQACSVPAETASAFDLSASALKSFSHLRASGVMNTSEDNSFHRFFRNLHAVVTGFIG